MFDNNSSKKEPVVADFFCNRAAKFIGQGRPDYSTLDLELSIVRGQKIFGPSNNIQLLVVDPYAQKYFQPGKKYKLTFEELED
jgi:hypothetical protein